MDEIGKVQVVIPRGLELGFYEYRFVKPGEIPPGVERCPDSGGTVADCLDECFQNACLRVLAALRTDRTVRDWERDLEWLQTLATSVQTKERTVLVSWPVK